MLRTADQWASAIARNRAVAAATGIDDACQITHGRYFWPLTPYHPGNDYDIEFIAHSLATKIRWAGVMTGRNGEPLTYSVAQHACHVADIVNLNRRVLVPECDWDNHPSPTKRAFHHDDTEAYIVDIARPLKPHLGDYMKIEAEMDNRIMHEFNVPVTPAIQKATKIVDNLMIFLERDELVGEPVVPYGMPNTHPGVTIHDLVPDFYVWDAITAKANYLAKHEEIEKYDGNHIPLAYLNRGFLLPELKKAA